MEDFLAKALQTAPVTVITVVAIIYIMRMMLKHNEGTVERFREISKRSEVVISDNTEMMGSTKELIRENLDALRRNRG